jgi:hypothetical protein
MIEEQLKVQQQQNKNSVVVEYINIVLGELFSVMPAR